MSLSLIMTNELASVIADAAGEPLETAGVMLVSLVSTPSGDVRLLAREVIWVEDNAYLSRQSDGLSISTLGYVPALGRACDQGLVPLWLHTHPGQQGVPRPSAADREVDHAIADVFRLRADTDWYGTIIVSPRGNHFTFSGQLTKEGGNSQSVDRIWVVGDDWQLLPAFGTAEATIPPLYDRSVRAFGTDIQRTLGNLRIGVVGAGGTGSSVCEQLVRLGVRKLTIIDGDILSESNVTRVYGSTLSNVGRAKVDVLFEHLCRIAPDLECRRHQTMITLESGARKLLDCDLIFGCTDDNAGRLILSRFSTYLMVPVIDLGVLLSSSPSGILTGIDGRVTVLSPGAACLVCRGRIDLQRAAAEVMTPGERVRLAEEGYAPALGGTEPAVVAFTTGVAAAALNEMLERLIGYGPKPRPSEVLLRWHEREISTNKITSRKGHYCDPYSGKTGVGDRSPFLDQLWSVS